MKTVTLDTNTVDDARLVEVARLAGFTVVQTTVTDRELESSGVHSALPDGGRLYEPFVLGESRFGFAVLGSESVATTFEKLLHVISNGSFPARDRRSNLAPGERRQLRDAHDPRYAYSRATRHLRDQRRKGLHPGRAS
jgi:hypothetical protein